MSRVIGAALMACAVVGSSAAAAASQSAAVMATVRSVVAKLNAGDSAGTAALCTPNTSVIDEFAPFGWSSCNDWGSAAGTYYTQNHFTDSKGRILKFTHVNVEGDNAYIVATILFSYKDGGKLRKEQGSEVYTLTKADGGWKMNSFAWFGRTGVDEGADATAIVAAVHDFAAGKDAPGGPPTAISDEFAPYNWQGADAAQGWFAGLQKSNADDGDSGLVITPKAPAQLSINGDTAYGTFPTVLTFEHKGKPARELGQFACTFEKKDGNWRIVSWAWATK